MPSLYANMRSQVNHAYQGIGEFGVSVKQGVTTQMKKTGNSISHTFQSIKLGCKETASNVKSNCLKTVHNIESFVYQNRVKLFFIGCSAIAAYQAPLLFLPAVLAGAAVRFEFARNLKKEQNPQKINHQSDKSLTPLEIAKKVVSRVDTFAFSAFFLALVSLPLAGGFVMGDAIAKRCMNNTGILSSQPRA